MKKQTQGAQRWVLGLRAAEWYSFELMVDRYLPPPQPIGAGTWDHLPPFNWAGSLRVLNRLFALGREDAVASALATNFSQGLALEDLCRIFVAADLAIRRFDLVAITQSERKRKAKVIADAARLIAAELSHPATQNDFWRARRRLKLIDGRGRGMLGALPDAFESFAQIAEETAELPKDVGNPNASSAHKLFFLREVTEHLYRRHGRPMRSLVLVLAGLYFDVSDMTTNDLAKYAQVKKERGKRQISSPLYL